MRANEFIPKRWYLRPELNKDKSGYATFSLGPAACVGKQLALFELRIIVTVVVTRFIFAFAEGYDGREVPEQTTDHFANTSGPLNLIFMPIEK